MQLQISIDSVYKVWGLTQSWLHSWHLYHAILAQPPPEFSVCAMPTPYVLYSNLKTVPPSQTKSFYMPLKMSGNTNLYCRLLNLLSKECSQPATQDAFCDHPLNDAAYIYACTTLRGWINGTALSLYTVNHKYKYQLG